MINYVNMVGRWIAGDWWQLEELHSKYGVCHSWRRHMWQNYCYTKAEAKAEQVRLNGGGDE